MLKHRRLFLSLALSVAFGLMAKESRAELISMTLSVGGGPSLVLDVLPGVFPTATDYTVTGNAGPGMYPGTIALGAINSFLAAAGSAYQFTSISGSSNFPGSPLPANLVLSGELHSVLGAGPNKVLVLTETESGFTTPPAGTPSVVTSSSSGNFTNVAPGFGHAAFSGVGPTVPPPIVSTGVYTVTSNSTGVNSGTTTGPKSTGTGLVPALYTLENVIEWGVGPGLPTPIGPDAIDTFGVTAQLTPVPEPASLVMMLLGVPLPLFAGYCLMRRRRALR
jgi:hypothetical protein